MKIVKNKKQLVFFLISVIFLVGIDQITKYLAVLHLKGSEAFVVIKGVFEFYYLQNTGAAWGMMSGARIPFIILTFFVLLIIGYCVLKTPTEKKYIPFKIFMILLSAGALGNFIDRLIHGYVIDFLYFKLIDFPIFNAADICVSLSLVLFCVLFLFIYKEDDFQFLFPKKRSKNIDSRKDSENNADNNT